MKKTKMIAMLLVMVLCMTMVSTEAGAISKNTYGENFSNAWIQGSYYSQGCYVGGNTYYYSMQNKLYKMNLKTKKRTLIYTYKDAFTLNSIQYYKNNLYVVIDKYLGTGGSYPYITMIGTDGTNMKQLDVGDNLTIAKGKLYYIKQTELEDFETFDAVGVYSMSPNGSGKKCLIKNDIISKAVCDGKNIYFTDLYGSFQTDLKGANQKQIAGKKAEIAGLYKNVLYYMVPGINGNTLYQKNLKTNKATKLIKKMEGVRVDALTGKIYYTTYATGNSKMKVYEYNIKTKAKKMLLKQKSIYCLNTFGNYISYAAATNNTEKNVVTRVLNLKTKKKVRIGAYYVS